MNFNQPATPIIPITENITINAGKNQTTTQKEKLTKLRKTQEKARKMLGNLRKNQEEVGKTRLRRFNKGSKEVQNYRTDKKTSLNKLNEIKIENTKKILEILNPIITKYVELNSISLIIPKKNIIVGKKNLDITDDVIILLNNKVNTLNFK